jgi:aldose 1-epimerase
MQPARDARFLLESPSGLAAELLAYGATLARLRVPDRHGRAGDVVLGFDAPEAWREDRSHLGSTIGRYANRIGNARFMLDGREVRLVPNEGPHQLHGGERGMHRVDWIAERVARAGERGVRFRHRSRDGDEGWPGNLEAEVTWWMGEACELRIEVQAQSDAPTAVSFTHHAYWNLRDGGAGDVLGHELQIEADELLAIDPQRIPTGARLALAGTAFDFRARRPIGARIAETGGGYDHCFVLRGGEGRLRLAARLHEPETGRTLELHTTAPALQLYTANGFEALAGRGGAVYRRHHGVCLEAQRFPDAPNHPGFPSARLDPGQRYEQTTLLRFRAA